MTEQRRQKTPRRFGCLQVLGLVALAMLVTAIGTFFFMKTWLFPAAFKPVVLSPAEEKILSEKLEDLDPSGSGGAASKSNDAGPSEAAPEPEPYSEKGLKREVMLTERELNALLSKNTDLAGKLAIDLSDHLISAKLRLPLDEDFPILGGKTLRLHSGVELSFRNGRPVVVLKGVTVMGIPVPNAWLGGVKNLDLVETFGTEAGFWKIFSDGIEDVRVEKDRLKITLKE